MQTSNVVSMVVAVIALVGTIITGLYTYTNRSRELDIELVKIGISILRADPKETQTLGAREWAVETIETFSGRRFSPEAKKELLENKLGFNDFQPYKSGYTFTPGHGFTYTPGYDSTYTPSQPPARPK
jgi:hypothetical protein